MSYDYTYLIFPSTCKSLQLTCSEQKYWLCFKPVFSMNIGSDWACYIKRFQITVHLLITKVVAWVGPLDPRVGPVVTGACILQAKKLEWEEWIHLPSYTAGSQCNHALHPSSSASEGPCMPLPHNLLCTSGQSPNLDVLMTSPTQPSHTPVPLPPLKPQLALPLGYNSVFSFCLKE